MSLASVYIFTIEMQATFVTFLAHQVQLLTQRCGSCALVGAVPSVLVAPVACRLCDIVHPRLFIPIGEIMAAAGVFSHVIWTCH